MADITKIPMNELEADLLETKNDIAVCQTSLRIGITEYSGGLVKDRLNTNLKIEQLIEKEIKRRIKCQSKD